jgi:hypothetical protein
MRSPRKLPLWQMPVSKALSCALGSDSARAGGRIRLADRRHQRVSPERERCKTTAGVITLGNPSRLTPASNAKHADGEVPQDRSSSFECVRVYVQSMVGSPGRIECALEVGGRGGPRSGSRQTDLLGGCTSAKNCSLWYGGARKRLRETRDFTAGGPSI